MASAAISIDQDPIQSAGSAKAHALHDAIIFVQRKVVKSVVTRELQKFGINNMQTVDGAKQAVKLLHDLPHAMLVIDWEHGEKAVVQVLEAAQGTFKVDTRPIYFLASEISPKLVSIASDYNIVQLHIGEITPKDIQNELKTITSFGHMSEECQQAFHEAAIWRSKSEWKRAEEPLKQLVENEPTNVRAGLELADNYFETADYEDAADVVDQMLAIDPDNMRALHLHARILLKQGDHEQALALLGDLCERGALNLDRLVDLGQCLMNLDQVDEASRQFDEALEINEHSKKAAVGKSQCELLKGNINEAVLLMRQIADDKEVAAIFNNTAILCMRRQQFVKGLSLYKAAVSQVLHNPRIQARITFNIGIGYLRWGKKKEAVIAFTRATELDAEFLNARHNAEVLARQSLVHDSAVDLLAPLPPRETSDAMFEDAEEGRIPDLEAESIKLLQPQQKAAKSDGEITTPKLAAKTSAKKPAAPAEAAKAASKKPAEQKLASPSKLDLNVTGNLEDFGSDDGEESIFDELDDSYFQSLIEK
ncbi:MAG: tetratricopeptide repeat protein [Oligoflexus sp.]